MRRRRALPAALVGIWLLSLVPAPSPAGGGVVSPRVTLTNPDADDQDDLCVWIHPTDPSLSTLIVSDKESDHLFVYDLQGNRLQALPTPGRPGNVDLRYGFPRDGGPVDIVVCNDRTDDRILVYRVDPTTRSLSRIDGDDLLSAGSYGMCLYRSPGTGDFHVFTTTQGGLIRQFELADGPSGLAATLVRSWDLGDITEGCVADDGTGLVYFAEEDEGIWRFGAEPGDPVTGTRIASVGDGSGLQDDVEGLALYYLAGGQGYLLASSQGTDTFHVYDRAPPHAPVTEFMVQGVTNTDGIEVTNVPLGPEFPFGLFACHDDSDSPKPIQVCAYEDLGLSIDTESWDPRVGVVTNVEPVPPPSAPRDLAAWPNPFGGGTELRFRMPGTGAAILDVVDTAGRRVTRLHDGPAPASWRGVRWDGRDERGRRAPAGVYFVVLETAAGRTATRVTLIR